VFFVPDCGCSSAELSPEEKNRRSHRGQALRKLVELIRQKYA
jgi:XTP/dITP diphosphohydrolase